MGREYYASVIDVLTNPKNSGTNIHQIKKNKVPDREKRRSVMSSYVPVWEKLNLTLEEAAAYSGIGINKLRELSDDDDCPFVLWNGSKRLLKRRKLDEYLEKQFSI